MNSLDMHNELHFHYDWLLRLIRGAIQNRLRAKFDPEDIVQSTFRTFYRRNPAGFTTDCIPKNLRAYLAKIALGKCHRERDYYYAAKRDVRKEIPCSEIVHATSEAIEFAEAKEFVQDLLNCFDARDRSIIRFHAHGYTSEEIADLLGCAGRTVRRTLEKARAFGAVWRSRC